MKKLIFLMLCVFSVMAFSNSNITEKQEISKEIRMTAYSIAGLNIKKGEDIEFGTLNWIEDATKFTTLEIKDENFIFGHNSFVKVEVINPKKSVLRNFEKNYFIPVKVNFVDLRNMSEIKQVQIVSKDFHSVNVAATIEKYDEIPEAPMGKYSGEFTVRVLYEN